MKPLLGIHHVSSLTSSAEDIYQFFTFTLGLRLVKKTVNQDDVSTYHMFFADDVGSPGTDMTFFDFAGAHQKVDGVNQVSRTSFRVPNDEALTYWLKRFEHYNVSHQPIQILFGKKFIFFKDFDEQAYALISDELDVGVASGIPWKKGPVPNEFAITGLGPSFLRINDLERMHSVLTEGLLMRKVETKNNLHLYEMGEGGNGASIIVEYVDDDKRGSQGVGSVHHIAFRVSDEQALKEWIERIRSLGAPNSGFVDRFYFKSLYARLYPNLLFEFATDGPGFMDDEEDYNILGETLALPPKFREHRKEIEQVVRPIDTKRSHLTLDKEYF